METNASYKVFLVHWIYSDEEWKKFRRWGYFRRGLWRKFLGNLLRYGPSVPEVSITTQKVWIGDRGECFRDDKRRLKRINIRDAGRFNLIEITYEKSNKKSGRPPVIYIPIPKGKLREAIVVHETLSAYTF